MDKKTNLTIEEKIMFLMGRDNWSNYTFEGKVPTIRMSDGPNGLRKTYVENDREMPINSTSYPCLSMLACSYNYKLAYKYGQYLADECIENEVNIILGPSVNIKRTPLCGRNFEYLSEDPVLAGLLAKEYIRGVQDKGVGTSIKHFCCNNIELDRHYSESVVSNRALYEIYTKQFKIALKANPISVMCSYNMIDGIHVSQNPRILTHLLKEQYGFKGFIVSDWFATKEPIASTKAGIDLEMPFVEEHLKTRNEAYKKGLLTLKDIDLANTRVLDAAYKLEAMKKKWKVEYSKEQRHAFAKEAAIDSMVLLKNENNILPLQKEEKVLLLGSKCNEPDVAGGGSGYVVTDYKLKTLGDELKRLNPNGTYDYMWTLYAHSYYDTLYINRAREVFDKAKEYDKVVIFVGTEYKYESEGIDRNDLCLPTVLNNFINTIAKINPNVIVILQTGSVIEVRKFQKNIKGLVLAGYCGEAINEALAELLTGNEVFSGKLAESYIYKLEDCPAQIDESTITQNYKEGILVGYRYYDYCKIPVLYPFGYGLSYAKFVYSNLKVSKVKDNRLKVSYEVLNDSNIKAKEVSEVYVSCNDKNVLHPVKELQGFSKDTIDAHETKKVVVYIDIEQLKYYDESLDDFVLANCFYKVLVGTNSQDLPLKKRVYLGSDK